MKAILDANLLLVLLAGSCDKRSLGQKKFVKDYGADDFNMLREMLSGFGEFFVTPNVITECSNLLCGRGGHGKNEPEARVFSDTIRVGSSQAHRRALYRKPCSFPAWGVFLSWRDRLLAARPR